MDYYVVNGYNSWPSMVARPVSPVANRVISAVTTDYIPSYPRIGHIKYNTRMKVVNYNGVMLPGGDTPTIPTYGQIFPHGRS